MTADQLLLDVQVQPLVAVRGATIQARFEAHCEANPWVEAALVQLARDLQERGRERASVKMLVEIVRWHFDRTTTGEPWKIDNSFSSRYARRIAERYPDLAPMFATRELRAA